MTLPSHRARLDLRRQLVGLAGVLAVDGRRKTWVGISASPPCTGQTRTVVGRVCDFDGLFESLESNDVNGYYWTTVRIQALTG